MVMVVKFGMEQEMVPSYMPNFTPIGANRVAPAGQKTSKSASG